MAVRGGSSIFEKAEGPYVLALIVSALGWYIGVIVDDFLKRPTAVYGLEIDRTNLKVGATIENLSSKYVLRDVVVTLTCDVCMIAAKGEVPTAFFTTKTLSVVQPAAHSTEDSSDAKSESSFKVTLPPGAKFGGYAHWQKRAEPPRLFVKYDESAGAGDAGGIQFVKDGTLFAWTLRHYRDLVLYSFIALGSFFVYLIVVNAAKFLRRK